MKLKEFSEALKYFEDTINVRYKDVSPGTIFTYGIESFVKTNRDKSVSVYGEGYCEFDPEEYITIKKCDLI